MDSDRRGEARGEALEVKLVNLWINRMIGDEQLPEDSARTPDGNLKEWPPWFNEGKPSPTGRYSFTSWRLWQKDSPLVESGLLGPVKLRTTQRLVTPAAGGCEVVTAFPQAHPFGKEKGQKPMEALWKPYGVRMELLWNI